MIAAALAAFGITAAAPAYALDVSVKTRDMGPFGASSSVYLSGPVETGDAEKLWNAIRVLDLKSPSAALHVTISSPGGSVAEALKIGRLLNKLPTILPVTITSQVGIEGEPLSGPGDCASACVLIYLGATYRFLDPASHIGVHQFSFRDDSNLNSAETASVAQLLAADVTEYLREVRVDPSLFSVMSQTFPEDIHWIDHSELNALRVVNENVYDQSAEYKNADGVYYLLLWQQSYWGENKIVAACNNGRMVFVAFLQPPDLKLVAGLEHQLTVLADGQEFTPAWHAVPTPTARFAKAEFSLDAAQLARFASARRVGARMKIPDAPVFFGFEMNLSDGKLHDTIAGCR
ncbi:ATP-dependent Clp protease proteolytic subunit [Mesorhizobium sp. M0923]|uniref:ATP-dependent Clp protease proteolytic subunit n=1 Tax=unclassified Mesorhizobium TaxID=325217 RepID=UPI00040BBD36|nr:ATP-dependent Clp protease proteolytic subunit [Mesorhizobium sp. L48C026A00]